MVGDAAGEVIQLAGVAVKAGVTKVLRSMHVCVRAHLCACVCPRLHYRLLTLCPAAY
jgi:hypothetical protein